MGESMTNIGRIVGEFLRWMCTTELGGITRTDLVSPDSTSSSKPPSTPIRSPTNPSLPISLTNSLPRTAPLPLTPSRPKLPVPSRTLRHNPSASPPALDPTHLSTSLAADLCCALSNLTTAKSERDEWRERYEFAVEESSRYKTRAEKLAEEKAQLAAQLWDTDMAAGVVREEKERAEARATKLAKELAEVKELLEAEREERAWEVDRRDGEGLGAGVGRRSGVWDDDEYDSASMLYESRSSQLQDLLSKT
ncbi:hypothetical protein HDU93_004778, partial [Gonapodya sp. JEL0774]